MATSISKKTSITDELLAILAEQSGKEKAATPEVKEALESEVPMGLPELKATDWETRPDGKEIRMVPFSELYWKPKHAPDHLVPIFRGYDAAEPKSKYVPPKSDYEWFSFAISNGVKPLVVGPTGCGKTLMAEYYAASTGRPCLRIEHNVELDRATVFGQVHITEGDTNFVPGMLICSADSPSLVILDEVSRATGHANMIYKRIMDRGEIYVPEMKDAGLRAVKPDPYWSVCGTDNTKGDGEDLDKYPMSNVQDAAFRNAWGILLEADYLGVAEEEKLINTMTDRMNAKQVKALARFSDLVHKGFKKGEINTAFSPRQLETICSFVNSGVSVKQAIALAYISFCSKSEMPDVQECLRATFE